MSGSRRSVAALLSVAHLLFSSVVMLPGTAAAQAPDGEPPAINFDRIAEGVLGDTQVFSATVIDDVGVDVVSLHYRLGNKDAYETLRMDPLVGTDIFTASVETDATDATVLQYYIEARDEAGNRSIQGFAFDPIERALVDSESQIDALAVTGAREPPDAPVVQSMTTGRKVLYGVLGVLAVGALAAAAGGSGGSSDNPRADDPGAIPLDIEVDPL